MSAIASLLKSRNIRIFRCRIGKAWRLCFSKYLLLTNTGITVCLGGIGDTLQQKYERVCGRKQCWDKTRTLRICATSLCIGPVCHYWYQLLDKAVPGKCYRRITAKVLVDQVLFSPINIAMFLVIMGLLEGMSTSGILDDLWNKGRTLFTAECLVWPPAQAINFSLVPLRFRVLWDNTISLGFDVYYSRIKFGETNGKADIQRLLDHSRRNVYTPLFCGKNSTTNFMSHVSQKRDLAGNYYVGENNVLLTKLCMNSSETTSDSISFYEIDE